jgi:branched-subunit amino acid ABC-type transport system permease component
MNKTWLKYGIVYALITIAMTIVFYYLVDFKMSIQVFLTFGIMILFMVMATLKERSINGGYLTYGESLMTSYLTALVGILASFILMAILLTVDPGLKERLTQMSVDASKGMLETMGLNEDQITEAMEKVEEEGASEFTIGKQFVGVITNSIFVFIIAAFISLFLKKNRPEEKF